VPVPITFRSDPLIVEELETRRAKQKLTSLNRDLVGRSTSVHSHLKFLKIGKKKPITRLRATPDRGVGPAHFDNGTALTIKAER
jgi:hypothetical protein